MPHLPWFGCGGSGGAWATERMSLPAPSRNTPVSLLVVVLHGRAIRRALCYL